MTWVLGTMLFWAAAWALNIRLAALRVTQSRAGRLIVPAIFGLTLLGVWEGLVRGLQVPLVILPPPSAIAARIAVRKESPTSKTRRVRSESNLR